MTEEELLGSAVAAWVGRETVERLSPSARGRLTRVPWTDTRSRRSKAIRRMLRNTWVVTRRGT